MSELYGTLIEKNVIVGELSLGVEYYKGDTGDSGVYLGEVPPEDTNVWIEPVNEDVDVLITENQLNEKLNDYTTIEEVNQAIVANQPDLSGYAKTEDIPDVSAYQTAEQVETAINSALSSIGVAEAGEY